jgi:hypothetical protein
LHPGFTLNPLPSYGIRAKLATIFRFGNISYNGSVERVMKILSVAAGVSLLACHLVSSAQTEVACGETLDAPLRSRAVLTIDSRPAGLEIVGTDQETIHVSCTADDADSARLIRLHFSGTATDAKLRITGPHLKHGNLRVRIEVPRKVSLGIDMPAGEVKVEEVAGNKDINLYAGQITISSTQEWNYRTVSASVDIGEVNAPVYGANKGGFFRSVTKTTADGEYRLHAHVITGQIDLRGRSPHSKSD